MDDKEVFFKMSKNKLNSARTLFSDDAYISLKDALRNIEITTEKQLSSIKKHELGFATNRIITNRYLEYLSRYNNNVLTFSSPKEIELEANAFIFSNLFKKFIDSADISNVQKSTSDIDAFITDRREILSKHFNIDTEITSKDVPNLIVPVKITLIGQNEIATFVQSLNMEKRVDGLSNDISEILFLQKAFSNSNKNCTAMAITHEPDKKLFPKQHDIWNQLRNISDIKSYDISDSEKVIEYAEKHGVLPFLKNDE